MGRTLRREREAFRRGGDASATLRSILDDAVELSALSTRDADRISVYAGRTEGREGIANRYYREALDDAEASPLLGVLFGVAATVCESGDRGDEPGLRDEEIASFVSGWTTFGPAVGTGMLLGMVFGRSVGAPVDEGRA
ncbi:hypothetical protein [Microbacterium aoyamense]|nr:hypothetical protein [Microbacterium aoyamense]